MARLKPIMRKMVEPTQSSFVPRRQITDNIIITQEVMHSMKARYGQKTMILKIDLEKAYDHIRWAFIKDTLQEMRLLSSLIQVIMNCISSCDMRVLWNGEVWENFKQSRGV